MMFYKTVHNMNLSYAVLSVIQIDLTEMWYENIPSHST